MMGTNWDREDDAKWPKRNKDGRQELEIRLGNEHIAFDVSQYHPPHSTPYVFISWGVSRSVLIIRLPRLDRWQMYRKVRIQRV
jgi:hypothetical protein